jgi:hypothetical protein
MEVLLEFLFELIIVLGAEVLGPLVGQMFSSSDSSGARPWLAVLGYAALGVLLGTVSLWIFPVHFIKLASWRLVYLISAPVTAGGMTMLIGAWCASAGLPSDLCLHSAWRGCAFSARGEHQWGAQ